MDQEKMIVEMELYLVRHGQTYGNVGFDRDDLSAEEISDSLLTETGEKQASLAADALSDINFDYIYSSALKRAVLTAAKINDKQKIKKTLLVHPLLTEVDVLPEYSGYSIAELKDCYGCDIRTADDIAEDSPLLIHTAFSDEKAGLDQAGKMLDYLVNKYKNGEKILVVGHAGMLTNFILSVMGFKESVPNFDIRLTNTGITKILFYKHRTNIFGDRIFHVINDIRHLGINLNDC